MIFTIMAYFNIRPYLGSFMNVCIVKAINICNSTLFYLLSNKNRFLHLITMIQQLNNS
jgi:hypothetical protein